MNAWILRTLRAETRAWWYHRQLRARGETAEARARERASIRSDLDIVRKVLGTAGAHVSTGIGGTTVHYGRGCRLSSHAPLEHMAIAQVLVRIGLPLVDTGPVEDKRRLVRLPLVAVGQPPDPEPWSGFSYAPLAVYAARAAATNRPSAGAPGTARSHPLAPSRHPRSSGTAKCSFQPSESR